MPQKLKKYHENVFKTLYKKILRSNERTISVLEIRELIEFQRTMETVPNSDLEIWTRELVKDVTIE